MIRILEKVRSFVRFFFCKLLVRTVAYATEGPQNLPKWPVFLSIFRKNTRKVSVSQLIFFDSIGDVRDAI